ncbi:MAG: hypothetical protein IPO61_00165 [Gammaproteobacteria bacterium]|nr:hypothetical protein [Gammaproteobacteria bacterium]
MRFAYELLSADGKLERGTLEAANEGEARRQLQRQGATVLGIGAHVPAGGGGAASSAEILLAFTELTTLLHSGLGIAESVASIASAHERDALRVTLEALGRAIAQGQIICRGVAAVRSAPAGIFFPARCGRRDDRQARREPRRGRRPVRVSAGSCR